jgi:hypothetical protein
MMDANLGDAGTTINQLRHKLGRNHRAFSLKLQIRKHLAPEQLEAAIYIPYSQAEEQTHQD